MIRIQQQPVALLERAATIITWVHLAERPLKINELLCSLATKDGDNHFNPRGIPIRDTLLNCCHGLVVMDRKTSTIHLVHYSLQEYLLQQNKIFDQSKEQWHNKITYTCLTYLKFPPSIGGDDETREALFNYTATQWDHHLRGSEECPDATFELGKEYLDGKWPNFSGSLDPVYREMSYSVGVFLLKKDNLITLPVHIAAFFGLGKIILHLRVIGLDLDRKDGTGRTPLIWAADAGYEAVVRILIDSGVALDSLSRSGSSPLSKAA